MKTPDAKPPGGHPPPSCTLAIKAIPNAPRSQVVGWLESGEIGHREVLDLLEARIAEVAGRVNALPVLCFERARRHGRSAGARAPCSKLVK